MRIIGIKQQRVKAKLTQAELGQKIGIGQSAIAQWEAGTTSPRLDKLQIMAELFQCTIDELVRKNE